MMPLRLVALRRLLLLASGRMPVFYINGIKISRQITNAIRRQFAVQLRSAATRTRVLGFILCHLRSRFAHQLFTSKRQPSSCHQIAAFGAVSCSPLFLDSHFHALNR
jgi:hypothetical protein